MPPVVMLDPTHMLYKCNNKNGSKIKAKNLYNTEKLN